MEYSTLISMLTILVRFGIPLIIFIGLVIGYARAPKFFENCLVDKRVISILILGALPTSIINVPIFFNGHTMLTLNLGGVIIPVILSIVFINKLRPNYWYFLLSVIVISLIAYLTTYEYRGTGVFSDFPWYVLPILVSLMLAFSNYRSIPTHAVAFAYSISTLGMLIGADISRVHIFIQEGDGVVYIGGLGLFDLIFLSGLYSLALAILCLYPISKSPSQTIKIESKFESKSLRQKKFSKLSFRALAFGIDMMIQCLIFGIIFIFIFIYFGFDLQELLRSYWGFAIFWWAVVFHIFYFIFLEWSSGQTPGKRFVNLRVINLEPSRKSTQPKHQKNYYETNDFLSIFTRNILRPFDLILFILVIYRLFVSPKHQRYGDLFAGTGVINL